jgi:PAS domain S-box-containing protein
MNNPSAPKNRRILVVDDNRAIHDDFRKILAPPVVAAASALAATEEALFGAPAITAQPLGYEIDSAVQGLEGVAMVQRARAEGRPYAMAFVDVRMPPGIDGVETTQKIWAVDPEVQIVLCTAYADYSWDEMFAKIGNSDGLLILKKPFDTVEVFQLVHTLTEKWGLHRQSRRKLEELEGMVAGRTGELQQRNAELAQERDLLQALMDNLPEHIYFKDARRCYTRINRALSQHLGLADPAAAIGKSDADFFPHGEARQKLVDEQRLLITGTPLLGLVEKSEFEGATIWMSSNKVPIAGADGKITGLVGVAHDITERKRAEESLQESKRFLQSTLNALSSHIAIIDEHGEIIEVNAAWNRFARENHFIGNHGVGDNYLNICGSAAGNFSEEASAVAEGIRSVMTGERAEFHMEYPCHSPKVQRWFVVRATRFDGDGPVRVVVAHENITTRKEAEESLRLLSSAMEQATESIVITDAELDLPGPRIVFVNPAYTRMTGYTAAEAIGCNPRKLQGPRTDRAVLDRLRKNLESGECFSGEVVNYRKDGTPFDLEWQITPLRNASGTTTHYVAIQRDATQRNLERKRVENQLLESRKLETVGQLAAGIAHEINTLLTHLVDG